MWEWWHYFLECRAEIHPGFRWKCPLMVTITGSYAPTSPPARPELPTKEGVTMYVCRYTEGDVCESLQIWLLHNEYTDATEDQLVYKADGAYLDSQLLVNEFCGSMK